MVKIKNKINSKINIDKRKEWLYNISTKSNIEIFTIKEYLEYKEKYGKKDEGVSDNIEEYQYNNSDILHTKHDRVFRKILEDKQEAVETINRVLKKEDKITAKEIEHYNSNFISEELRKSESDIVYKLKDENVFFLIEHQSYIDYNMPRRILGYELDIIDSCKNNKTYINKGYLYPTVIAIVLYTGHKKWDAKLDLNEQQIKWLKYEKQRLSRYNVIDVNEMTEEELLKTDNLKDKILLIEKSKNEEEIEENLNKIQEGINTGKIVFTKEQRNFFIRVIKLILQKQVREQKIDEYVEKFRREDNNMLAVLDMIDREHERIWQEGRINKQKEIASNMLKEKMPLSVIQRLTGLKIEDIKKLK